jgi:hypothetical protein
MDYTWFTRKMSVSMNLACKINHILNHFYTVFY